MKYVKILRFLGIAVILSLLMMAIPVLPVAAVNDIIVSPNSGKIGDTIRISGSAFAYGESERQARVIFSSQQVDNSKVIGTDVTIYKAVAYAQIGLLGDTSPAPGTFSTNFTVPATLTNVTTTAAVPVTSGTYYIYITITTIGGEGVNIFAITTFTVTGSATLRPPSPASGPVGTSVTVSGANFPPSTAFIIQYDGAEIPKTGDSTTDSSGVFISIITIPQSIPGPHTITVTAGTNAVTATFTVTASATLRPLSPTSGPVGANVTISGSNFPPSTLIIIKYDGTEILKTGDSTTDSSGVFISTITIPQSTAGTHNITATAGSGSATATFTVTGTSTPTPAPAPTPTPTPTPPPPPVSSAKLNITASSNAVGALIGIGGVGFKPNVKVTLKYDDKDIASMTTDANGMFVTTFQAPPGLHGDRIITASDGTNTSKVTFTVESKAPPIPQPLLPEMSVKVKPPITFDWEDVTDASAPVTYNLQISDEKGFSAQSIIVEKKVLESSKYVFTASEGLKLAAQETPYYWRVKAVDAAGNESEWTGSGQFYVPLPFSFPPWTKYVIYAIVAIFIFLIGMWMGRRSAYSY
jgi:hypothetical protein